MLLNSLQRSLRVLNVSGNNLDSLKDFTTIQNLTHFSAADNKLTEMKEVATLLSNWRFLSKLDLHDNPFCLKSKYRDRIIIMSNSLSKSTVVIIQTSSYMYIYWPAHSQTLWSNNYFELWGPHLQRNSHQLCILCYSRIPSKDWSVSQFKRKCTCAACSVSWIWVLLYLTPLFTPVFKYHPSMCIVFTPHIQWARYHSSLLFFSHVR